MNRIEPPRPGRPRPRPGPPLPAALLLLLVFELAVAQEPARPVSAEPLARVAVARTFEAPAAVVPANASRLAAEVPAVVTAVHFDVGARVEAGAVLVELDDEDYRLGVERAQAQLAAARARLRQAELRLRRAEELATDGFVSADDLLARETDVDVARAEGRGAEVALGEARRALERTRVRAPFAGVVTARAAQLGAYVVTGQPLLTLVEAGRLEVDAEVDAAHAHTLADARELTFSGQGRAVPVVLARLSGVIETESRIQRARLSFVADGFPAGATGVVRWRGASGQLPAHVLVRRDGRLGVFLVDAGRARFLALPEAQEGRPAAVDLPPETLVITGGVGSVNDGDRLDLVSP